MELRFEKDKVYQRVNPRDNIIHIPDRHTFGRISRKALVASFLPNESRPYKSVSLFDTSEDKERLRELIKGFSDIEVERARNDNLGMYFNFNDRFIAHLDYPEYIRILFNPFIQHEILVVAENDLESVLGGDIFKELGDKNRPLHTEQYQLTF